MNKTFQLIDTLKDKIDCLYTNGESCVLTETGESYELQDDTLYNWSEYENIKLKTERGNIIIPYFLSYRLSRSLSMEWNKFSNSYYVTSFLSENFDKEDLGFYRLIIPINKSLDFYTTIEYDEILNLSFTIENFPFSFLQKEHKGQKFLIIESFHEFIFSEFSEFCFSILISYGFLTGDFFQGKKYFVKYENSDLIKPIAYYFNSFRETIHSTLRPICTNPYAYKSIEENNIDLPKLSKKEFSSLCEKTTRDSKFRTILLQIIEATKVSLLMSSFILAVCLEELTVLFLTNKAKEKKLSEEETNIFNKVISFIEDLGKTEDTKQSGLYNDLKSKLNELATKKSNMQKILSLFYNTGIEISSKEKEALKNRNKLLHGSIPDIKGVKLDTMQKIDTAYWYLQLRLYTLISSLILKKIGYKGKVLNHYCRYEQAIGFFSLGESFYKDLSSN
jgi:hypothetical protein